MFPLSDPVLGGRETSVWKGTSRRYNYDYDNDTEMLYIVWFPLCPYFYSQFSSGTKWFKQFCRSGFESQLPSYSVCCPPLRLAVDTELICSSIARVFHGLESHISISFQSNCNILHVTYTNISLVLSLSRIIPHVFCGVLVCSCWKHMVSVVTSSLLVNS